MTSRSKSGRSLVFPLALPALGLCACGEPATLHRWLMRAMSESSLDDVFAE